MSDDFTDRQSRAVVATEGLVDALLGYAAESEPTKVTIDLAVSDGETFPPDATVDEGPVFSHYYLPNVATSTSKVFGMNLTVPPGQTQGRFISHPMDAPGLTTKDTLHEVVFVAVPPWTREDLRVFDRAGRRRRLRLVDAEPPTEPLPDQ